MVTLNAFVHTGEVHGQEGWKYRMFLEEYTSQFLEPENWNIYKTMAEKTRECKNKNDRKTDKIKRQCKKKKDTPYINEQKNIQKEINRTRAKEIRKTHEKEFEEKYGMTPSQYNYRKQKEYLMSKKEKK